MFTLIESVDLGIADDWTEAPVTQNPVGDPVSGIQWIKVTREVPSGVPRGFYRIKVTVTP